MEHLNTIKNQLKERLPKEGITPTLKALKELLPEHTPKRNVLLQLESEYNEIKLKGIEGILSDEALMLANNQFRKRLIEFIDSLEADDFNVNLKRSRLRKDHKVKQGHVLYRIPHQMQLFKKTRCIVRIALDKATLIDDIDVDEHTQVRSNVRVSDYMKVILLCPEDTPSFSIRSTSEPVQFIDEDEATEWKFDVTPLLPGEHVLELKVVVIEIINGVERVREKSLEESVVIVTEAVEEMDDAPLQSADMDFVTSDAAYTFEKEQSGFRLSKAVRTSALVLAALMVVSTATFAFIPPVEQRWLITRYLENTPEAYEQFINENPTSDRVDDATFRKAKLKESPQELQDFIKNYKHSKYLLQAKMELQRLEEKAWQHILSQTNVDSLRRFIELFPSGKYNSEAIKMLEEVNQLNIPNTTLNQTQGIIKLSDLNTNSSNKDNVPSSDVENEKTKPVTKPQETPAKTESVMTPPPRVGGQEATDNEPFDALKPKMVLVKGGTFQMGEKGIAEPVHTVTVSDFYLSKYEVTFEEYDAFCEANKRKKPDDEGLGRGKRPVIRVSWDDATAYCKWLSEKTGKNYRLPTEAEWEYAARGGAKSKGFKYAGSDDLDKVAWYYSNSKRKTQPIGGKDSNELGIYDMSGNVREWCSDWYGDYSSKAQTNPKGSANGKYRVVRGGSWVSMDVSCRVSYSDYADSRSYSIGFWLAGY